MTPRPQPLPPPPEQSHRYWTVDLNPEGAVPNLHRGPFLLRFPSYSVANRLIRWLNEDDAQYIVAAPAVAMESFYGAMIGACWHHRAFRLDAEPPKVSADLDVWQSFGEAVVQELYDWDLTLPDIQAIAQPCTVQMVERLSALLPTQEADPGNADAPEEGDGSETPSLSTSY